MGGAVAHIEAAVVFWAFDEVALYQSGGEVGVAVRADAVGGIVLVLARAIDRVGGAAIVEAQHILAQQRVGRRDLDPTFGIGNAGRNHGFCRLIRRRANRWGRQFAFHKIAGVLHLAKHGGDDLTPRIEEAAVGRGHVLLHHLVKSRQVVIWYQRKHVVFDMVVHVPIQEAIDRVHVNRAAVHAVIEHILRETGVLGETIDRHQPCSEEVGQADVKQRQDAAVVNACGDHRDIDQQADAGFEINRGTRRLGDVGRFFGIKAARGVADQFFEIRDRCRIPEKCGDE